MQDELYLRRLTLPDVYTEEVFLSKYSSRGIHSSCYPYGIFPNIGLEEIKFTPITMFCGDNGSGKSTLLNILAQCLGISHKSPYNAAYYLPGYVDLCYWDYAYESGPWDKQIITSDDVFDLSFHNRNANMAIHSNQSRVREEAAMLRKDHDMSVKADDPEDVARFHRKAVAFEKHGTSRLILQEVGRDMVLHSNGENSLKYFFEQIRPHGFYLLDEPENSLSIKHQLLLKDFIEEMARYESCQFVIATHSPFLLALNDATIYNLDINPVRVQHWSNIEFIRNYYDFFHANEQVFTNPLPDDSVPLTRTDSAKYAFIRELVQNGYQRRDAELMLKKLGADIFVQECLCWIDEVVAANNMFPIESDLRNAVSEIVEYGERPADIPVY